MFEDFLKDMMERSQQSRIDRQQRIESMMEPAPTTNMDVVQRLMDGQTATNPLGQGSGNNKTRSSGSVETWLEEGARLAGINLDPTRRAAMLKLIHRESSGNPRAVNNWDSNAKKGTPSKGILQTIEPTFKSHMVPGHGDIFNPVDNIAAALRYIKSRYGDIMKVPSVISGRGGY